MPTTYFYDDSTSGMVRKVMAAIVVLALGLAISGKNPAPYGIAAQVFVIGILALTLLLVNIRAWVFPFALAFAFIANGVVVLASATDSNWLSIGIYLVGGATLVSWVRMNPDKTRATPLDDDDDELEPTVQVAPGLAPERVQEILQVREDLMNLAGYFIGEEIGATALSYDQKLEHALKKDATGLDELLASANDFLDQHDEAIDALHHQSR